MEKKLKIAYCLSGQPRGIKIASDYVKRNLLDRFDVDVFCHSWQSEDPYSVSHLIGSCYKPNTKVCLYENTLDKSQDILPKIINERYLNTPNVDRWPPFNTVSAFYSMYQSFYLMHQYIIKKGIKYDFVIRSRYDYALNGVLPFDQMEPDKLYIPDCRQVPTRDFGNDQFAVGSLPVMREYMSTYLYMDDYYNAGTQMIGEEMMAANLRRAGLVGEKLVYMNMNNPFPPGPYNGTWHSLVREDMEQWQQK